MSLVELLEQKKRCLEKLLSHTEAFLNTSETESINAIDLFCSERETLLTTISLFNHKIEECTSQLAPHEKADSLVKSVSQLLSQEERLVASILKASEHLLTKMFSEQDRLAKELNVSEKNQKTLEKFKSIWMPESGAKLDGKL